MEVFSKKNSSNSHFPKGDGMVVVALNQNLQSKFVLKNAFAQKITVVLGIINMNCRSGFRKSLRGAHTAMLIDRVSDKKRSDFFCL